MPSAGTIANGACTFNGDGSLDRRSASSTVDREPLSVTAPVPFSEIGGFRLIRMLGFGGFGDVYEVERDGARYALKLFRAELAADVDLERFRREVRALQIEHEHLVRYVDSGEAVMAGRIVHWVAMELLEGQSLRQLLQSAGGSLPIARACEVGRQMALGLAALHERNIAHRDVKPENAHVGSDGIVRLLDFGLVALLDSTTITIRGVPGTLAYMAPEQLRGERVLSSDIYSLGVVLYELLTGRRPHHGSVADLIYAIQHEAPEPPRALNAEIPRELERLVLSLLEKEPMDRPASARAVVDALKPKIVVQGPPPARRVSDGSEPRVYVRTGRADVNSLFNACLHEYTPTGIVVGATEPSAVERARRAANGCGSEFVADPLVLRYAFMGFARTKTLLDLPYAPKSAEPPQAAATLQPYTAREFRSRERCREFARTVLAWQDEKAATRLLAPTFPIRAVDDQWIPANATLLDCAVAERDVFRKPIVGQIAVSLEAICSPDAQTELVNRLRRCEPDEWWLALDPLSPPGNLDELYWAIRFALLVQGTGPDVIIARPSYLRHILLAFGIVGIEVGLGRLAGLRFSDFQRDGGPGYIPPQFEFPSLICPLPRDEARVLLESGEVPEASCECRACKDAKTIAQRLEATAEHNAHMLDQERRSLAGVAPADRVERLQTSIESALAHERRLRRAELLNGKTLRHLRVWPALIERAAEEFLQPGRLRRRLG